MKSISRSLHQQSSDIKSNERIKRVILRKRIVESLFVTQPKVSTECILVVCRTKQHCALYKHSKHDIGTPTSVGISLHSNGLTGKGFTYFVHRIVRSEEQNRTTRSNRFIESGSKSLRVSPETVLLGESSNRFILLRFSTDLPTGVRLW